MYEPPSIAAMPKSVNIQYLMMRNPLVLARLPRRSEELLGLHKAKGLESRVIQAYFKGLCFYR